MRRREQGFTFMEMIMVIIILGILISVALPNFRTARIEAQEAVLKEDLFRLRDTIDQYYADKGKYPASLDTLVEEGYLRKMPVDPMTNASDWQTVAAEADTDSPNEQAGIYDVKSSSSATSLNGTPYNEW
jgi:general secretion pathway protein G